MQRRVIIFILFFMSFCLRANMNDCSKKVENISDLPVGCSLDYVILQFGEPTEEIRTGNFLTIIYREENELSYQLTFSLSMKLFKLVKNEKGRETIVFWNKDIE